MGAGKGEGTGTVIGIDLLEMEPVPGADLLQGDFMTDEGKTILMLTLSVGWKEGAQLCLQNGANPNTKDKSGKCITVLPGGSFQKPCFFCAFS